MWLWLLQTCNTQDPEVELQLLVWKQLQGKLRGQEQACIAWQAERQTSCPMSPLCIHTSCK